ncbi:Spatacsin [Anopheles sinensis]|uniref:Spatacsin n=1 Tax=Anopheles sinensis TaxID=74873 RepID=A0A084VZ42_ANOSI|nr:Spatacsin [Anopheles sinensis]
MCVSSSSQTRLGAFFLRFAFSPADRQDRWPHLGAPSTEDQVQYLPNDNPPPNALQNWSPETVKPHGNSGRSGIETTTEWR